MPAKIQPYYWLLEADLELMESHVEPNLEGRRF